MADKREWWTGTDDVNNGRRWNLMLWSMGWKSYQPGTESVLKLSANVAGEGAE